MSAAKSAAENWRARLTHWHDSSREPGLTALLVLETALIFLVIPLTGMGLLPEWVLQVVFAALIISILAVTWHSHAATIAVLVAVGLSAVGTLVWREDPTPLTDWLSAGGRLIAITALSIVIGRVVFGSGRVTFHRVQGAVLLYLNFGLFFFTLYRLMSLLVLNAFGGLPPLGEEFGSGAALLYFSFSTLTTVGYGDIVPLHPLARNLANLEAILGQLYPATLLARLVSLELEHRRQAGSS